VLEVGQAATVTVASTDTVLTGSVSSIGILNASTTSTPSYTVLVAIDPTEEPLFDGSSAQVVVTVAGSGETLTVPSSAVHVDGSTVTVQVLADDVATDVVVERGAAGTELTEITSGLEEGDEVVLADLTQSLVSDDATEESSGLSGLSGDTEEAETPQFPSGGFGGGQMGTRPGS
jgi:multidrug efflux pump subunit AcrA (membrane-fusion protein)